MSIDTNALNAECRSFWTNYGTTKTAAEVLAFCAKFQADATVAQTCSSQAGALGIRRELCEAIPTASLTSSCTAYWTTSASSQLPSVQTSFCNKN